MCAGTPLEGTCVETFFSAFAACFRPAGLCSSDWHQSTGWTRWWENGAKYNNYEQGALTVGRETYTMGTTQCLLYRRSQLSAVGQYCQPGFDPPCAQPMEDLDLGLDTYSGGALYDSVSGIFTCPDGTQVNIGPDLGGCATLNSLLNPMWCTAPTADLAGCH
jgi:hypothetical protein